MFKTNPPIRQITDTKWELTEDLVYDGKWDQFLVPIGFETDGASIPAALGWLLQNFGRHAKAAFLHDAMCEYLNGKHVLTDPAGNPLRPSSNDVDHIFRRVLKELNVGFLRRWTMWCGVRWGALFNRHRRPGILRDLLKVIVVSVMVAPVVVPGVVVVSILRFVDNIITAAVSKFIK